MGVVTDLTGFFIARFFLGVTESGASHQLQRISNTDTDMVKVSFLASFTTFLCGTNGVSGSIVYHFSSALPHSLAHSVASWPT